MFGVSAVPAEGRAFFKPEQQLYYVESRSRTSPLESFAQFSGSSATLMLNLSLLILGQQVGPSLCAAEYDLSSAEALLPLPLPADWSQFPDPQASDGGVSTALILGVVAGCVLLLLAVALVVRWRRRSAGSTPLFPSDTMEMLLGEALRTLLEGAGDDGRPAMAWNSGFALDSVGATGAPTVSATQLLLRASRCRVGEEVGRGNFGAVFLARLDNKQTVAVKMFTALQVRGAVCNVCGAVF